MSSELDLRGAGTALVTPFDAEGSIDMDCFRSLVRRQVDAGVRLLIPCGTTGESATLSVPEREALVKASLEEAAGRALVVAGTGSNDTRTAVAMAAEAASWGADAILSLAPPYNKPPQDALVDHFRAVAEGAGAPVVVYNVPSRVGVNLNAETILALAEVPGIAAVKEAAADMPQAMEILRNKPKGFSFLSGEDALTFAFMAMGGEGLISVVGNVAPAELSAMVAQAAEGNWDEARRLHERLLPVMEANFCESNPIPVKAAMSWMGLVENNLRRPLRPLLESKRAAYEAVLREAGVLGAGEASAES